MADPPPSYVQLSSDPDKSTPSSHAAHTATPSWFDDWSFSYLNPMLRVGKQKSLQLEDLPALAAKHNASRWLKEFSWRWKVETANADRTGTPPSIWRVVRVVSRGRVFSSGLLVLIETILAFFSAYVLERLIRYLSDDEGTTLMGAVWLGCLFVTACIIAVIRHVSFATLIQLGMDLQTGLVTLLYAKLTRLSQNTSKGHTMTLVATDSNRIRELAQHIHILWWAPLQILLAMGMAYRIIGTAAFAALGVALLIVPVNWYTTTRFERIQDELMAAQQSRMKRLTEVLQSILVVKLFSWEHSMARRILRFRIDELAAVKSFAYCIANIMTVIWSTSTLMAVACFGTYYAQGHTLTASTVFPVIYLLNFLTFPLLELPYMIGTLASSLTSMRRLQAFYLRPEVVSTKTGTRVSSRAHGFVAGADVPVVGVPGSLPTSASTSSAAQVVVTPPPPPPLQPVGEGSVTSPETVAWLDNARLYWEPSAADEDSDEEDGKGNKKKNKKKNKNTKGKKNQSSSSSSSSSSGMWCLRCCGSGQSGDDDAYESLLDGGPGSPTSPSRVSTSGAGSGAGGGAGSVSLTIRTPEDAPLVPTLNDVTLRIPSGQLVAVVGPVGAGKSSLLSALLGEMVTDEGLQSPTGMVLPCGVAENLVYVPQQAFIRSATIKDNILAHRPMHQERYQRTIEVSALQHDLGLFAEGDMTEIGERGVTLSGGQKQRISLARAVYRVLTDAAEHSTLCLLDDPLSAVDAHVGEHLFSEAIVKAMGGARCTRVLVTHQLQFLPNVDRIIVMEGGTVTHDGSYSQLVSQGVEFASLVEEAKSQDSTPVSTPVAGADDGLESKDDGEPTVVSSSPRMQHVPAPIMHDTCDLGKLDRVALVRNTSDEVEMMPVHLTPVDTPKAADGRPSSLTGTGTGTAATAAPSSSSGQGTAQVPTLAAGRAIEDEERFTGAVGMHVYKQYFASLGGRVWQVTFLLMSILLEALKTSTVVWLSIWAHKEKEKVADPTLEVDTGKYLLVFVVLGLATAFLSLIRNYSWFHAAYLAAMRIHERMLGSVLRSPHSWFTKTPQGRILNRFSKDQDVVDQHLPDQVSDLLLCLLEVVSQVSVILVAAPMFGLFLPFMLYMYYRVTQFYRCSSRELKRLRSITSSPVHSHFSETADGLATVRAYAMETHEVAELLRRKDDNNKAFFASTMSDRWIGQRIELMSAVVILVVGALALVAKHTSFGSGSASMLALSITYTISLMGTANWFVRMTTAVEAEMSRVERMEHYAGLPSEAPLFASDPSPGSKDCLSRTGDAAAMTRLTTPPSSWPSTGTVTFDGVVMTYREGLDPVLRGVNFHVEHGWKVGIVGRTGAGKSSCLQALFRIVELSAGKILVDGRDIAGMGLADLRRGLSIVPQDPVLFSGTIRSNLDAAVVDTDVEAETLARLDAVVPIHGTAAVPCTDDELWAVLEQVGLESYVRAQAKGLDAPVEEAGQNLSVGQRQLLCLGRALLRRSKIIVLDEATSNCDAATDQSIQRIIRTAFARSTVITIAHRLPTIIDYDRVLVMGSGKVLEYESPAALLGDPASHFSDMVDSTGETSARFLRRAASKAAALSDVRL